MRNGLEEAYKPKAFSIMLNERAFQYYFDHLQGKRINFEDLCGAILKRFLTGEQTSGVLRDQDSIKLETILSANTGRRANDWLNLLVVRLEDIQSGLLNDYQKEEFLEKKLQNAVKGIKACKLDY